MTADAPASLPGDDLEQGRAAIERVDREIVRLLAERVRAGAVVAQAKRARALPVLDPSQEARVVRRAAEWGREAALPEEDVRDFFWRVIALTRRAESDMPGDVLGDVLGDVQRDAPGDALKPGTGRPTLEA